MVISVHNAIRLEYENRRRNAILLQDARRLALYEKVPEIAQIDRNIHMSGIRFGKSLLNSPRTDTELSDELSGKFSWKLSGELSGEA